MGYIGKTMSSPTHSSMEDLAVDERLVAPESRHEIYDGKVVYVAPADEPHGTRHSKISALLEAHAAADYDVASDMLTRTSKIDDIAPDASVFPRARHPKTGGRQLEELAFEVVSTERLSHAADKAARLSARGVRRVFAIDVSRGRALEWSVELATWSMLDPTSSIVDRALGAALPIEALVLAANTDDANARALLVKRNPVLEATLSERWKEGKAAGQAEAKAEAKAEAVIAVLAARGIPVQHDERERILETRDLARLDRWLIKAVHCASVAELFVDH